VQLAKLNTNQKPYPFEICCWTGITVCKTNKQTRETSVNRNDICVISDFRRVVNDVFALPQCSATYIVIYRRFEIIYRFRY